MSGVWAQIQYGWGPCKKMKFGQSGKEKDHVRTEGEDGHLQAQERAPAKEPTQSTP